ncbi:MAG TPA: glycosyltransferase family 1 protein [Micromonosporaceae bacterium]|nr:glycosyltransferase family 1 protein [Micromonosporaceae bacterium]
MRVAIVTESFPPDVNGVAHSVEQIARHLVTRGHEPLVVAPEPSLATQATAGRFPFPVVRVPSVPLLGYRGFRLGVTNSHLAAVFKAHRTDLVHLASPFVLGARGVAAAQALNLPTVSVFQTDVAGYCTPYKTEVAKRAVWWWLRRIHNATDRTLAPSTAAATSLYAHGIRRVWLWRRGVDTDRFDPRHRSTPLRQALAPDGEAIVGYVGRLAVEKQVELLAETARLPGVRLVIVGDGPAAATVRRALPDALFLGQRRGTQLGRIYASLDVFAHTGAYETFGQSIQEAMASGVPVVAPAAGGPIDLVAHDETGYLVPPGNGEAIARAVQELTASPERRYEFGATARRRVARQTWQAVGDELIDHYIAVRHGRGAGTSLAIPAASPIR